jgi:hypothetical protein
MRLSPRWRTAVLTLHVVAAVGWLGSVMVLLALGAAGVSGAVDAEVAYPAMRLVGLLLFVPLSFLAWMLSTFEATRVAHGRPYG